MVQIAKCLPDRVYVAGRDKQRGGVEAVITVLRKANISITMDWTNAPQGARSAALAKEERDAVLMADAVVLVWAEGLLGALIETGMAIGQGIPVVVLSPERDSVFWQLETVSIVSSVDDLLDALQNTAAYTDTLRCTRRFHYATR